MSNDGSLISWKSKKQQIVALSTCEAEYVVLAPATQEAKFLRQLFADMQGIHDVDGLSVSLLVDNQCAIALANNPVHHQRSKHIDTDKFYFLYTYTKKRYIQVETPLR